jgi:alkanesulfonate monooxygenase SsuD/methylene tetrahydromethanopterin reductase-like flavin-dependent oxidoreductase (luciferase family)
MALRSAPFGPGSISIGLYPQFEEALPLLADLRVQARTAAEAGFDGVTLAEHHGGFKDYLPNPGQVVGWLLGENPDIWGAACPLLMPLRSPGLVIEEMAWMAAAFPGRVGAGFAPGYFAGDFEIAGTSFEDRGTRFARELPEVVGALSGRATGRIAADWAVQLTTTSPVPTVSAAVGPMGLRRAANAGSGVIIGAFNPVAKARRLFEAYAEAGGTGPRMLIRRVWLGTVAPSIMDELAGPYRQAGASYLPDDPDAELVVADPDPVALAQRLAAAMTGSAASALSVRFSLPGFSPEATFEQITRIGHEVLPRLRDALSAVTT